jgi:hypothetical protein
MAMDILPIQGSSVPCERIFSSAKETLTPRRSRLKPDIVEAVQMIKYALKGQDTIALDFTEQFSQDSVIRAMEDEDKHVTRVPQTLAEFREWNSERLQPSIP